MRVKLLYIPDCPNHPVAAQLLQEILREHGSSQEASEISAVDFAPAEALAFPASPTIRIDGKDVDPTLPERAHRDCRAERAWLMEATGRSRHDWSLNPIGTLSTLSRSYQLTVKHSEKIAPLTAVIKALSTVICCLPLGIAAAAGAAGFGVVVEPLRLWLL